MAHPQSAFGVCFSLDFFFYLLMLHLSSFLVSSWKLEPVVLMPVNVSRCILYFSSELS